VKVGFILNLIGHLLCSASNEKRSVEFADQPVDLIRVWLDDVLNVGRWVSIFSTESRKNSNVCKRFLNRFPLFREIKILFRMSTAKVEFHRTFARIRSWGNLLTHAWIGPWRKLMSYVGSEWSDTRSRTDHDQGRVGIARKLESSLLDPDRNFFACNKTILQTLYRIPSVINANIMHRGC